MVARASDKIDKAISWMLTSNEPTSTKNVKYRSQRAKKVRRRSRRSGKYQTLRQKNG